MIAKKLLTAAAIVAAGTLALSGCSGGAADDGKVTMTFWHNSTTGDGKAYWVKMVNDFEAANPNVTIKIQAIQNEDMDGKLQTALNSGGDAAPDIFMARGGGKLAAIVAAGKVKDLTDVLTSDTKKSLGGTLDAFKIDGKNYGLPTSVLPEGIYYSTDLFKQAGITSTPTTIGELEDANAKLKAAGIAPIALGAKDAWPAAHWYYNFALRACSQDTITKASQDLTFDDPCWEKAGEQLADFVKSNPYNDGFLTTSAQQGAGSSAGLLANHKAAMELMGAWDPGVIASLTPDTKPLPDLGWFPFPNIDGGKGGADAMMGGLDGFSCYVDAPKACADFLNFIAEKKNQEAYATAFQTIPASQEAQDVVTDPSLKLLLDAYNKAPYVTLWLDTMLGQNVGNALNVAVVNLMAGQGTAKDIVTAVNDAAKKS